MLKDFKQKERNKAIKITDIAIEKVRKLKIFGFIEDEKDIYKKHTNDYYRLQKTRIIVKK